MSLPSSTATANTVNCHITARVHHHPSRPPRHPNDKAPRRVTPLMPLPSLRDVGIPIPPKRPRHGDNNNAMSSTMPMPTTTPCRRSPPSVECYVSEYEGTRRRKVTRGSEISTTALIMPIPYYTPICIGGPQRRVA